MEVERKQEIYKLFKEAFIDVSEQQTSIVLEKTKITKQELDEFMNNNVLYEFLEEEKKISKNQSIQLKILNIKTEKEITLKIMDLRQVIEKQLGEISYIRFNKNIGQIVINKKYAEKNEDFKNKQIILDDNNKLTISNLTWEEQKEFSINHSSHLDGIIRSRYGRQMKFIIEGLLSHKKGIFLDKQKFKSISELKGIFNKLLKSNQIGEKIKEPENGILIDLLKYHEKGKEKLENLDYFEINYHPEHKDTKCFFVVRKDGTKEDFSYVKCIKEIAKFIKQINQYQIINMEIGQVNNLKAVKLKIYEDNRFVISGSKMNIKTKLFFDLENNFITLNKKIQDKYICVKEFSFFIGVITFKQDHFFLFAENSRFVAKIKNHKFYEIEKVSFVSIKKGSDKMIQEALKIQLQIFENNFYFSLTYKKDAEFFFPNYLENEQNFQVNFHLLNFVRLKENMKEWDLGLFQGLLSTQFLIFDQIKLEYVIFAKFSQISNLIEFTSFIQEEKKNLWCYTFFINMNYSEIFNQNISQFLKDKLKKILMIGANSKKNEKEIEQLKNFEIWCNFLALKENGFKYNFYYIEDEKLSKPGDFDKFYNKFPVIRNFCNHYKETWYEFDQMISRQQVFFIVQSLNSINKTVLLCAVEIIFEIMKMRLNHLGVIYEYSQLLNFTEFYHKTMFNFFEMAKKIMKTILKFYPCPVEELNHNNFYFYKQFKKDLDHSYFFLQQRENLLTNLQGCIPQEIQVKQEIQKNNLNVLIVSYNIGGLDPLQNSSSFQSLFEKINGFKVDLIVIGLQELMELKLKFKNFKSFIKPTPLIEKWDFIFKEKMKDFELIDNQNLMGLQMFILKLKNSQFQTKIIESEDV